MIEVIIMLIVLSIVLLWGFIAIMFLKLLGLIKDLEPDTTEPAPVVGFQVDQPTQDALDEEYDRQFKEINKVTSALNAILTDTPEEEDTNGEK